MHRARSPIPLPSTTHDSRAKPPRSCRSLSPRLLAMAWWQRRTGVGFAADDVEPWTWVCAERGRKLSAVDYLSAVEYIQAWTRRLSWWWHDGYDLLLTPTLGEPPPPLGSFAAPNTGVRSAQIVSFTYAFNLSGHPAISLPCHRDDGLPIGVQLIAVHGREDLLLQVSADLEQAMTWTTHALPVDLDLHQTTRNPPRVSHRAGHHQGVVPTARGAPPPARPDPPVTYRSLTVSSLTSNRTRGCSQNLDSVLCSPEAIPGSKWTQLGRGSEIETKSEAYARLHEDDDSGQRRAIGPLERARATIRRRS